jgi:hypothetical protein
MLSRQAVNGGRILRHLVGLVAVVTIGATVLAGCSSSKSQTDLQVANNLVAAVPATSPVPAVPPAGRVISLPGPASAIVADPRSDTLAVAITSPPEIQLYSLADPKAEAKATVRLCTPDDRGTDTHRTTSTCGPATGLTLGAPGGPLLAAAPTLNTVFDITPGNEPGTAYGTSRLITVAGGPTSAALVNGQLLVALPSRNAVELVDPTTGKVARTITGQVTPQQVVSTGDRAVLIDQLQSAVFDVQLDQGSVGTGLRAGDGATNGVADSYGRVLVTDTRTGELLAFSPDPIVMRQRYPVPGAPYGIAYDSRRDLAWVTLTQLNQVVGFDMAGGEPVRKYTLPTVRQPNSVAVDPNSGRVFVASADGGGIEVIQP